MEQKINYVEASPEEFKEWRETDFWNKMDFDPMVMFVVIPAIIQISCLAFMATVMFMAGQFFD